MGNWKQITTTPEQVGSLVARGTPDWPVTLTYDAGDIATATYTNGAERYRLTLNYTSGDLTSVVYARSSDSGSTYTDIGTEALVYTDGILTSTTWTPA